MEGLVSIIVPTYNAEMTIEKCINSLYNQSYKDIEIIIIDDGSSDHTEQICKELQKLDNRILYEKKINGGVSSARNMGISISKGKYLCFVDADDYVNKNYIYNMMNVNSDVDIVITGIKYRYSYYDKCHYAKRQFVNKFSKEYSFIQLLSDRKVLNAPFNKLFKRDLVEFFSEDFCMGEDLLFNLSYLAKCNSLCILNHCDYIYDCRNVSAMRSFRRNGIVEQIELLLRYHEICSKSFINYDMQYTKKFLIESLDSQFLSVFKYLIVEKEQKEQISKWIQNDRYVYGIQKFDLEPYFLDSDYIFDYYKEKNELDKKKTLKKQIKQFFIRLKSKKMS